MSNNLTAEKKVLNDLVFVVAGRSLEHNTAKWDTRTNRHTTTSGHYWGWIEGPSRSVCWSNDETFNRVAASKAAAIHNRWLEDKKPLILRLIEARERVATASAYLTTVTAKYDEATRAFQSANDLVVQLEAQL